MKKRMKHEDVQNISLKFDGGLNYSQSPANIKDNELTRAYNIIYDNTTGTPETRPGTTCLTTSTCSGTYGILRGYLYEKDASTKYYIAACDGKLQYRSGASLDTWTTIQTPTYTSDFSAGVDSFTASWGTAAGNIDSIGGQNDNLRFTVDSSSGTHYLRRNDAYTIGREYTVNFYYYIPSGQSNVDSISLPSLYWNETTTLSTLGAWTAVSKTFTATANTIRFYAADGGVTDFQDAGGDDVFYIRGVTIAESAYLNDKTTVPSMVTFNNKLIVADGGTNLKYWDGSTYSQLDDGLSANAIEIIKNRIVINSTTSRDLVTFSAPNDETKWNTATEGAVGVRAGYGDNMNVTAFAVYNDDLVVFKKGNADKKVYRVNVASSTTSDWYISELSNLNTCQNAHCAVSAFNNIYFMDTNGFKSLKGVTEYGDLLIDSVGAKVNNAYSNSSCKQVVYVPQYSAVWYLFDGLIYTCSILIDSEGNQYHAFTDLEFSQGTINWIFVDDDYVYLCGDDGYLYRLNDTISTDATSYATTSNFISILASKEFSFFSDGILRKTKIYLNQLNAGSANLSVTTETDKRAIKTFTMDSAATMLYSMTAALTTYTTTLYEMSENTEFFNIYNRVRGNKMLFTFATASGRAGVEGLKLEVAQVGN